MTTPLSEQRLAEIRARVEAAQVGPWEWWTSCSFRRLSGPDGKDGGVLRAVVYRDGQPGIEGSEEDMSLLAHARTDIPDLLEEVERLRAEVASMRQETAERQHAAWERSERSDGY